MTRLSPALFALFLATGGCSVVLSPGETQCATAADCAARGFSDAACVNQVCVDPATADPIWGCLGNVVEPVPDPSKKVAFPIALLYAIGGGPFNTGKVDICDKLDVECNKMSPDFPKGITPDAEGNVLVNVVEGFDGYVRITDKGVIVDSRVYVGRPIVKPPTVKAIQLLRPGEPALLAKTADKTIDPTRGLAILLAVDCSGVAAGGIRFEVPSADDASSAFYLINQSPTLPPTATMTDADGFGGYFNLTVGQAVARSIRVEGEVLVGQSSFQVLADTVSYVQIAPTPK